MSNFTSNKTSIPAARVLCAEDEPLLRRDICEELSEAGFVAIEAAHGVEALEQIDAVRPDLILCDINMPGRNGYELLAEVRARGPDLAETPFVFLTALSDPREVVDGKRAGADDYLVKPVDFDLLLATVEARLRQVRRMREKTEDEFAQLRRTLNELGHRQSRTSLDIAARALDPVAPGVILVDGENRMLLANRAAQRMASQTMTLTEGRTPEPAHAEDARRLRQALRQVLDAGETSSDAIECMRLTRDGHQRDLLAMIYPLPHNHGDGNDTHGDKDPAAVILLSDPEQRARLPGDALARLFDLTPTEARIALALADGLRPADIAREMDISSTTVTFHLRNLFQKTDTHRQAELVALVLAGSLTLAFEREEDEVRVR
ncbi:response regulator [Thioalkalivibrio sp. ALMg13-2]|uniref:response regulator n=1 Tax=Thioalkalivibrio sp. ALMg13-2 TaxID=1158167 RepID=UPI000375B768|nr:response regulator [Thioalkalivibrio sp. ALMg13-2]